MEITLEKIELVKDRTGADYKTAKEALEKASGNVVDAIIAIEEEIGPKKKKVRNVSNITGPALLSKMKEIVLRGNVTSIKIKRDGKTILDVPLNLGLVGVVIAPWGVLAGVIATLGLKCSADLVKTDGTVISLTDKAGKIIEEVKTTGGKAFETAKSAGSKIYDTVKDKAPGIYEQAREKGEKAMDFAREKGSAAYGKAKKTVSKVVSKGKNAMYNEEDFDSDWFDGSLDYSSAEAADIKIDDEILNETAEK